MLILTRRCHESVVIQGSGESPPLKVIVVQIRGGQIKLGFEGPNDIVVHRSEVWDRICADDRPEPLLPCLALPSR